jgi:hypothetical protein
VTAPIFWLNTSARWNEIPSEFKHSGAVGSYDVTTVFREELMRIAASGERQGTLVV